MAGRLMGYAELSAILNLKPESLKNIYCRDHGRLPPAIFLPGFRGPRWDEKTVEDWIAARVVTTPEPTLPSRSVSKKKRGRPRIWQGEDN